MFVDRHQPFTALSFCLLATLPIFFIPHPAALLSLPVLFFGSLIIIRKPFVVCMLFIMFSFFRIHEVFPTLKVINIPEWAALVSYAMLLYLTLTNKNKIYWRREHTAFAIFFGWVLLSVIVSDSPHKAFNSFTSTFLKIGIMLLVITWLMIDRFYFNLFHIVTLFSGLAVGYVALYNSVNGIGIVEGSRVTIPGALGDPNDLSLVLSFPMGYAIAFIMTKGTGKLRTILGLIGFIVFMTSIIATQSRGGLLAIVAVLVVFGFRIIRSRLLLLIIGSICLMVLVAAAGISDRKSGGASEEGVGASIMGRIHAWETALHMGLRNPITGVGLSLFLNNYWDYATHSRAEGKAHVTHSTWFQVLAEAGIVGFAIFIHLIVTVFMSIRSSLERLDRNKGSPEYDPLMTATTVGTYAGLVGFCVSGSFLSQGFLWPVYIITAISIAIANYMDKHFPKETSEAGSNQSVKTPGKN